LSITVKTDFLDSNMAIVGDKMYQSCVVFQWDPMITTLPGLYWVSIAILKTVSLVFTMEEMCPVLHLRTINVLLAAGNFGVLWKLVNVLSDGCGMVMWH